MKSAISRYILFTNEGTQTGAFMGDRAARIGGHGVPVPRAKPWGRWERNWRRRRKPARHRRVVASRMRGVAPLDLSWSDGSLPWRGDGEGNPSLRLPRRERREVAPALSPRMPEQQGSPGWEGQKGRPEESECPKLSR